MTLGEQPKIDLSLGCNDDDAKHYMSLIDALRWLVEMGHHQYYCCGIYVIIVFCDALTKSSIQNL